MTGKRCVRPHRTVEATRAAMGMARRATLVPGLTDFDFFKTIGVLEKVVGQR